MNEFTPFSEYKEVKENNFSPLERAVVNESKTTLETKSVKEFSSPKKQENENKSKSSSNTTAKSKKTADALRVALVLISALAVVAVGVGAVNSNLSGDDMVVDILDISPLDTSISLTLNVTGEKQLKAVLKDYFTYREQTLVEGENSLEFTGLTAGMTYELTVTEVDDNAFSKKYLSKEITTLLEPPIVLTPVASVEMGEFSIELNSAYFFIFIKNATYSLQMVLENQLNSYSVDVVIEEVDEDGNALFGYNFEGIAYGSYTLKLVESQPEGSVDIIINDAIDIIEYQPSVEVAVEELGVDASEVYFTVTTFMPGDYNLEAVLTNGDYYQYIIIDLSAESAYADSFVDVPTGTYKFRILEYLDDGVALVYEEEITVT